MALKFADWANNNKHFDTVAPHYMFNRRLPFVRARSSSISIELVDPMPTELPTGTVYFLELIAFHPCHKHQPPS